MDLVKQEYWDSTYYKGNFTKPFENHPIKNLIRKYFSETNNKSVFEIGCYPGGFLTVFGDLGYQLNGIDLDPKLHKMRSWLSMNKYSIGSIEKTDFFELDETKKYDVVSSYGFIEHFYDYKKVITKHSNLLSEDGIVLITVPNYGSGLQFILHKLLDYRNLKRHNLKSMNPKKWEHLFLDNGFEVLFCGFFGEFNFWINASDYHSRVEQFIYAKIRKYIPLLKRVLPDNNKYTSPFCGIVARKQIDPKSHAV